MIELRTQKELRAAAKIGFCCICGKSFGDGDHKTRQHVPPKAIFAETDRDRPLILPAHEKCNNEQSPLDTVIGQLVAALHGKYPTPDRMKLHVGVYPVRGGPKTAGVNDLPLQRIIFRWVRCFHAALYSSYLVDSGGMIFPPLPAGDLVNGEVVYRPIPRDRLSFTRLFKQQTVAGRTDAVFCYNEKCQYRCTWVTIDDGRTYCLFALRLYNWEELGDANLVKRGCLGYYFAPVPPNGAQSTELEIAVTSRAPLDPFAI